MFQITSILVSTADEISIEHASNADYIWLFKAGKLYAAIVVLHDRTKQPIIYRCFANSARSLIMQSHNSYPVRIADIRSFVAHKLQHLSALDEDKLREALINELELAFPEFEDRQTVAAFVNENFHWLHALLLNASAPEERLQI